MAKQSLKVAKAAEEAKFQAIGAALSNVGELIGTYSVSSELDKVTTIDMVTAQLKAAMDSGLTEDMLAAPSKAYPGECYIAIVSSINLVRAVNELPEYPIKGIENNLTEEQAKKLARVRDNYMSKIRAFVRDRGVNPLDLYGNYAADKQAKAKKAVAQKAATVIKAAADSSKEDAEDDADEKAVDIKKPTVVELAGVQPLRQFLASWITANRGNAATEFARTLANDLMNAIDIRVPPSKDAGKKQPVAQFKAKKGEVLSIDQII